jgi:hypothetical protein
MVSLNAETTFTLEDLFAGLRSPVYPGHDYFVENPPATLELDPATLRSLEIRTPFFIDHGWSFGPDPDVVPFVWDRASGGQPRFSEAEALTDYDSGHFGLVAVSAPDATSQARLYRVLAKAIVNTHLADRDLLSEWFEAQGPSSSGAFAYFDAERSRGEEKLLAPDDSIDRVVWDARLDELAMCLDQGAVRKHHIRWLEFLAHSVDVARLMGLIRAAQSHGG